MENYGVIVKHLRHLNGLSVQQAAKKIGRSKGWLSEIENDSGRSRITEKEFSRIVVILEGVQHQAMFKTWVANFKNRERTDTTFDGAVLKFIRLKKNLSLNEASKLLGLSTSQISKLENGCKSISYELRNKIMIAYGYSPSSFKNLATDPHRSKVVPQYYKLEILLKKLNQSQIEEVFSFSKKILENNQINKLRLE
jgi:transcriptional regulator with XRE-family HTH domain